MTPSTGKGDKVLPFIYKTDEEYIERQSRRARWLIGWFILLLFITIATYLVIHLQRTGDGLFPMSWRETDVEHWQQGAVDWLLWSLAGTLVYLLWEVGLHYRDIRDNAEKRPRPPSFIEYTPWNLVTLVRGPMIALVILFFFNAADLRLTGPEENGEVGTAFKFAFKDLDHRATLLLAFVLGFYSRVARQVLDGIMKSLFGRAWAEAHGEFRIEPGETKVALGETAMFKTNPPADVIWAASLGTIDGHGQYTAPKELEHAGKRAVITAVTTGTQSLARSASVTLVPFLIFGPKIELDSKPIPHTFSISPAFENVKWTIAPDKPEKEVGKIDQKTGVYTTPPKEEATSEVTITASAEKKDGQGKTWKFSESLKVTLAKPIKD